MSVPPSKQPQNESESSFKTKFKSVFGTMNENEWVDKVLVYARTHIVHTTAFILLIVGILMMLFNSLIGELLVGISVGYYFSDEIAYVFKSRTQLTNEEGMERRFFIGGLLLAFFIVAPYLFFAAIVVVAFTQLWVPIETQTQQAKLEVKKDIKPSTAPKKPVLYKVDFLAQEECKKIRDKVFSLKDHWIDRGRIVPFYTLGIASYMDSSREDDTNYRRAAKESNPILKAAFPDIYARLAKILEKETGFPVQYEEDLAYPGFHIFLASKSFEKPLASIHFDLQFESIHWPYKNIDFAHPISITIPIVLPHLGGGLNYWEVYRDEIKETSRDEIKKIIESQPPKYLQYETGKIIIQNDRLCLHQIAPGKDLTPGDERITLQGHGLVCDGILRLYW